MAKYKQIDIASIKISREGRQRKVLGDIGSLADSIKRLGLINPITLDKDSNLIAGERRLEACKSLGHDKISVRFYEDLDSTQRQIIEYEENAKREALTWQDQAISLAHIHTLYKSIDSSWTLEKTSDAIGVSIRSLQENKLVAEHIVAGVEKIIQSPGLKAAVNIIERETTRAIDNEMNNLLEVEDAREHHTEILAAAPTAISAPPRPDIINGDFISWVNGYKGRRFNLIHCDFPYGIDHQDSEQGGTASGRFVSYEDSEETYWNLCRVLCDNIGVIATASAHVMFWFSMKFYQETISFIEKNSDLILAAPQPLIWLKSDGKGIASDINRRPRNVYETALMFSRGDRKILTPVDNAYACPTSKNRAHASEKPEPMLRHFFRMFVDENAEVLDPTCGAGSSIRAAESLGAKRVLGIELIKEFANEAQASLSRSRALEKLSNIL